MNISNDDQTNDDDLLGDNVFQYCDFCEDFTEWEPDLDASSCTFICTKCGTYYNCSV